MDDSYIHSVTWLKCCGYVTRPSKTIKVKVSVPSKTIKMGYWGPSKTIKMTPEGCGHPDPCRGRWGEGVALGGGGGFSQWHQ